MAAINISIFVVAILIFSAASILHLSISAITASFNMFLNDIKVAYIMQDFIRQKGVITPDTFESFANIMLNRTELNISNRIYRIAEIELFYRSSLYDDEYVSPHPDRLKYFGHYFHKYKNGAYKEATYKGLELTFGNGTDIFCGVLIRSMFDCLNVAMIHGPCNCVNRILSDSSCDRIADLVELNRYPKFNNRMWETQEVIMKGPRLSIVGNYPEWKNAPLRCVILYKFIKRAKRTLSKV